MNTYRHLIYMILDEIKGQSDDFTFTEGHIKYLADKWRALLLKQRYANGRSQIPDENFQTLCIDLTTERGDCENPDLLKSTKKLPFTMLIGTPQVTTENIFGTDINMVSKERFKYAGSSKYAGNSIYATLGQDSYLYLKSNNPQFLNLEKVIFKGVFSDPQKALEFKCENDDEENNSCDPLDLTFPLESSLVPLLIQQIVRELLQSEYATTDNHNNATDDIPDKMMLANAALQAARRRAAANPQTANTKQQVPDESAQIY